MKKLIAIILALMLIGMATAEEIDLTQYTDQELDDLSAEIALERERRMNERTEPIEEGDPDVIIDIPLEEQEREEVAFEPIQSWSRGEKVAILQEKLNELGFSVGKADGIFGDRSVGALKDLQKKMGWEESGAVNSQEELDAVLEINIGDGINLATGSSTSVTVIPSGENSWCNPFVLYPTSADGRARLNDDKNIYFTVSFDWKSWSADTAVEAGIELRFTEEKTWYEPIGYFSIPVGDSHGHCVATFIPNGDMRLYGSDWLVGEIGNGNVNRGLQIEISNFKFETGIRSTDWVLAPEDESMNGIE